VGWWGGTEEEAIIAEEFDEDCDWIPETISKSGGNSSASVQLSLA
jgi:hypothetical protein